MMRSDAQRRYIQDPPPGLAPIKRIWPPQRQMSSRGRRGVTAVGISVCWREHGETKSRPIANGRVEGRAAGNSGQLRIRSEDGLVFA